MQYVDMLSELHGRTGRDYLARVRDDDKAACAEVAKQYGREYWDGDRCYGYGGYSYDGRWEPLAERLIRHYGLKSGDRILDIGCGKGYLLFEIKKLLPDASITGIDISSYAILHAKPELKPYLGIGDARDLSFSSGSFDFIISLNVLHNLYIYELEKAVGEISRVGKGKAYVAVESYRNEREKANLLYWQLTCECFFTPEEWRWLLDEFGYGGDYGFIFFE